MFQRLIGYKAIWEKSLFHGPLGTLLPISLVTLKKENIAIALLASTIV